ncbi:flagellar M-ring protein FliF C-terminal domain-containing protein, partial [Variovorax sp. E3]|uniref:flagellar M-ring protein FliF C-terminal domain-containing protein n=1 Tax=Variovorax sp. E3 TaxID=1914993 RepID=UPI0027DD61A8
APNAPGTPPPGTPGAPGATAASTASASAGPSSTRKDTTTNYELDRTIRHVQQAAGGVKRLSVAVVVNNRDATDAAGKTSSRALTPAELEQIRNLAKEAMGFSQERGDSLNVVNSAFARDADSGPAPELPFWRDRENIEIGKTLGQYLFFALLALFAWLAVLRPLMRRHAPAAPAPAPVAAFEPVAEPDVNTPSAEESLREREATRKKADMDYAHQIADKDPKLVATLIQHWMNTDD